MSTQLDTAFVQSVLWSHETAKSGFETLVNEVKRLEAYNAELEARLTPEQRAEASSAAAKKW